MATACDESRRSFLRLGAAGLGVVAVGIGESGCATRPGTNGYFRPSAWLEIATDDTVTIFVSEAEMGQGVMTSMPMLVAEELEVAWDRINIRQAPVDPVFGWQGTGGSTSIRQGWRPLREVGAAAREMLRTAAANRWQVPVTECEARLGAIHHKPSSWRLTYGELTHAAARLPVPKSIALKKPSEFRIIGKPVPRVDTPSKVNGTAIFGMDVRLPGMRYAAIRHSPRFGGQPVNLHAEPAMAVRGVRHVVPLDGAVAVVADDFWSAHRGLEALVVEWQGGSEADSVDIQRDFREALNGPGTVVLDRVAEKRRAGRQRTIEAVYATPYQAHATMEPMCCTAQAHADRCTLWAPTQQPTGLRQAVAKLLFGDESPSEQQLAKITVHTTLMGGGFGRRNLHDFALETVKIARVAKVPVKLIWTREEDMQHGYYHPATLHRLRATLDPNGRPWIWEHCLVGSTHTAGARELSYTAPNQRLETVKTKTGIPVGPWRSVAHAYNAFAVECFVDELAVAAGKNPYAYRVEHMSDPRLRTVLELAATKARWGKARPKGRHVGIAAHASFGSYVAQVVELSVGGDGAIRVHHVVCAADCGIVINPDTVKAQIEGSVVYGLTAALKGQITIQAGRVVQSNFHDYPVLRMDEMPTIDVHIVPSGELPGGIGEPAVPPLAPALANAVYAATGKRIRRLPIVSADLR